MPWPSPFLGRLEILFAWANMVTLRILIDTNREPENFLKTNAFYDSKIVGKCPTLVVEDWSSWEIEGGSLKIIVRAERLQQHFNSRYCEDRDPHLAYTARDLYIWKVIPPFIWYTVYIYINMPFTVCLAVLDCDTFFWEHRVCVRPVFQKKLCQGLQTCLGILRWGGSKSLHPAVWLVFLSQATVANCPALESSDSSFLNFFMFFALPSVTWTLGLHVPCCSAIGGRHQPQRPLQTASKAMGYAALCKLKGRLQRCK